MRKIATTLFLFSLSNLSLGQDSRSIPTDSNECMHGKIFKFFLNGRPKSFKTFHHGFLYGEYEKYYRNGAIKENGFIDDVNIWTLLLQPSKVIKERFKKNGLRKNSIKGEIIAYPKVPPGKCNCLDNNVKRVKSLLVGKWGKNHMKSFTNSDKIIDSVFNKYNTQLIFNDDNSWVFIKDSSVRNGIYNLSPNKLELKLINDNGEYETLMDYRWPKKTLYPDRSYQNFNLQLLELLNVESKEGDVKLNTVIVNFKRI